MEDKTAQIEKYQNSISAITRQVMTAKNDLEELSVLKNKINTLIRKMESSAAQTKSKINVLPSIMQQTIKLNLFSGLIDCVSGTQYHTAIADLYDSKKNIQNKIDEINNKIRTLNNEINNYTKQIQVIQITSEE